MKKLICLFTAVCCLLSALCSVAFADESETTVAEQTTEAVTETVAYVESEEVAVLKAIGVFTNETAGDADVTRGQVLAPILKMAGFSDKLVPSEAPFADVPVDSEYASDVCYAKSLGIISGDENGNYNPDEKVEFEAVVKMLVSIAGYSAVAEERGGYPSGYVMTASRLGMLNRISDDDKANITFDVLARIIVPSLEIEIADTPVIKSDGTYYRRDGKCFLDMLKIVKVKGVVTESSITTLKESKRKDTHAAIGDIRFLQNGIDVDKYLGYNVYAYLTEATFETESKLLYIAPERNNVIELNYDEIDRVGIDNLIVSYTEGDRVKEAKLYSSFYFIYNGLACDEYSEELLQPNYGKITLIDNDYDNVYDVFVSERWYDVVVQSVVAEDRMIDNKLGDRLDLGKDDSVIYNIRKGSESIGLEALAEGDSILVTDSNYGRTDTSSGNRIVNMIVSGDRITGTVSEIKTDTKETKYKIEGNWYAASPDLMSSPKMGITRPAINMSGSFMLNAKGFIVDYTVSSLDLAKKQFVFLANVVGEATGFDTIVKIRVFTDESQFVAYDIDYKLTLDGDRVEPKELLKRLKAGQVVTLNRSESGKIDEIDTVYVGENEGAYSLHQGYVTPEGIELRYKEGPHAFADRILIDMSTLVFVVPLDLSDESIYDVVTQNVFKNDKRYRVDSYLSEEGNFVSSALLYRVDGQVSTLEPGTIMVVGEVFSTVNDDGLVVEGVKGWSRGGGACEFTSDTELINSNGVEEGDVILYAANNKGVLKNLEIVYDYSRDVLLKSTGIYGDSPRYIRGFVYRKRGNEFNIFNGDPKSVTDETDLEIKRINLYRNGCVYDYENKKLSPANAMELRDYMGYGDNCTKFVLHEGYGDPGWIVLYK